MSGALTSTDLVRDRLKRGPISASNALTRGAAFHRLCDCADHQEASSPAAHELHRILRAGCPPLAQEHPCSKYTRPPFPPLGGLPDRRAHGVGDGARCARRASRVSGYNLLQVALPRSSYFGSGPVLLGSRPAFGQCSGEQKTGRVVETAYTVSPEYRGLGLRN